jgi:hypothetical protein
MRRERENVFHAICFDDDRACDDNRMLSQRDRKPHASVCKSDQTMALHICTIQNVRARTCASREKHEQMLTRMRIKRPGVRRVGQVDAIHPV